MNKGITLIALVITIIVLLILVGITIASLTGENGLLSRATEAREETERAQEKEQIDLAVIASYGKDGTIDLELLASNLSKIAGITNESGEAITSETAITLPYKVKYTATGNVYTIDADGNVTKDGSDDDDDVGDLPTTAETAPWLPTDATPTCTDWDEGITVIDDNDNEWVWIVVPKSVTDGIAAIGEEENPTGSALENKLKEYAATVVTNRGSFKDELYSQEQTGLTPEQYTAKKRAMLNSIKTNGGFWIGKYEAGTENYRASGNKGNTSTHRPLIQKDKYPYTYVTCAEAEGLAETLTTGLGGTGSLMFGTQWDLVMAYIKNNTNPQLDVNNSTTWGNHKDSTLTITNTNAKGWINPSDSSPTWNAVTEKAQNSRVLLTTGASDDTNVLNICDIAGNVWEWTLEYSSSSSNPCTERGGSYYSIGTSSNYPATGRYSCIISGSGYLNGFRPSLY
ncbi:MAG: hypothetical protein IKF17_05410 [Clostridia bacterium]|nr:hypothetical protein [Clostridia bacterium]